MSILVFRTSLQSAKDIQKIAKFLDVHQWVTSWYVDLEDWETILRIEATKRGLTNEIAAGIKGLGYLC